MRTERSRGRRSWLLPWARAAVARAISLITCVLLAALLGSASDLDAQTGDAASTGDGWLILGTFEPPPQTFEIRHARGRGFLRAEIAIAPQVEARADARIIVTLGQQRVTIRELERRDPGGLALSWGIDLSEIEFPDQAVQGARAIFDSGAVAAPGSAGGIYYEIGVPDTARRLLAIEVDFAWQQNKETRRFDLQMPRVTAMRLVRLDPEVERAEALPLEFFRVLARTDLSPSPERIDSLTATVSNGRSGERVNVKLTETDREGGTFVSGPILVSVEGSGSNLSAAANRAAFAAEVFACPGDRLAAALAGVTAELAVTAPDDDSEPPLCELAPPPPRLELTSLGPTTMKLDPQTTPEAEPLRVRLVDENGAPVAAEAILWRVLGSGEVFLSYTDEDGVARLDFGVGHRGLFTAVVDGLPVGQPFVDGRYALEALPRVPLIAALTVPGPVRFDVDLVQPTYLQVLGPTGAAAPVLLYGDEFYVGAWLGRADRQAFAGQDSIEVVLRGSGGDDDTIDVVKTAARGYYESRVRTSAGRDIGAPDGGTITASIGSRSGSALYYSAALARADAETQEIFALLKSAIETALKSGALRPEERAALAVKAELVARAAEWFPLLIGVNRVAVAAAYIGLLVMDPEDLGESIDESADSFVAGMAGLTAINPLSGRPFNPLPFSTRDRGLRFAHEAEARHVIDALRSARREGAGAVVAVPSTIVSGITQLFTYETLQQIILAPFLGAYVAYTGWTVDGKMATVLERVVGGLDAFIAVASVGTSAAARAFPSLGRSGRALGVRAAAAETSVARAAVADSLSAGPGAPLARAASREAAAEAVEASSPPPRGIAARERDLKSSNRAGQYIKMWEDEAAKARTKLKELEGELDGLVTRLEEATAARRGTKKVQHRIGSKAREIEQTSQRIKVLEAKAERHRRIKNKADRSLARREGRDLSAAHLENLARRGELPAANDQINGVLASAHYEAQVNRALAAEGYGKGTGIPLNTAYTSPLGNGFGLPPKPGVVKRTHAPNMDHFHPQTFDVADSKFYDFAGAGPGTKAAAQRGRALADTIEKGRLVQRKKLGEAFPQRTVEEIRALSQTKSITIVTPTPVPDHVAAIVRTLVGPRTAANLKFRVVAADVAAWTTR